MGITMGAFSSRCCRGDGSGMDVNFAGRTRASFRASEPPPSSPPGPATASTDEERVSEEIRAKQSEDRRGFFPPRASTIGTSGPSFRGAVEPPAKKDVTDFEALQAMFAEEAARETLEVPSRSCPFSVGQWDAIALRCDRRAQGQPPPCGKTTEDACRGRVPNTNHARPQECSSCCAICLDPLAEGAVESECTLECRHTFHLGCMQEYIDHACKADTLHTLRSGGGTLQCPICRLPFRTRPWDAFAEARLALADPVQRRRAGVTEVPQWQRTMFVSEEDLREQFSLEEEQRTRVLSSAARPRPLRRSSTVTHGLDQHAVR